MILDYPPFVGPQTIAIPVVVPLHTKPRKLSRTVAKLSGRKRYYMYALDEFVKFAHYFLLHAATEIFYLTQFTIPNKL